MSTYMAKKETMGRKWHILDAANKPLGRTAALAASILRGKHKPEFTPHVDCGDFVIIINSDKAVLTGNKLNNKKYYHHSGWIGGLKEVKYSELMEKRSDFAMELAIKRMLPRNSLGAQALKRLHIYKDDQHKHAAQKPELWAQD
jgi:large subunit ribosomal protein L13